jgi:hypothetical protein
MTHDSARVAVSTYVPEYQRGRWREHAQELGMSQSEFVRTMVQAGRRGFAHGEDSNDPEEVGSAGSNPGGSDLKTAILEILREEGPLGWADLVEAVTGALESELETALFDLQEENLIRHTPREGNYAMSEGPDGD